MASGSHTHSWQRDAESLLRTMDFWRRAAGIYLSYKGIQIRAAVARAMGHSEKEISSDLWDPQHAYAGDEMYRLCVDLRGFYLKAGQFIGSRGDFVPEQICKKLVLLCDKVPPMPAAEARQALLKELCVKDLSEVFEWIDLETPLGSASVSQVHKAQLRRFPRHQLRAAQRLERRQHEEHVVQAGQGAWDICNLHGMGLQELQTLNKGMNLESLTPGQVLHVPHLPNLEAGSQRGGASSGCRHGSAHSSTCSSRNGGSSSGTSSSSSSSACSGSPGAVGSSACRRGSPSSTQGGAAWGCGSAGSCSSSSSSSAHPDAAAAVLHAVASGSAPKDGLVAVKIQYPDALGVMSQDLKNLRAAAYFLSKTELKFDLVSAVDELQKQIKLEFDFMREARVMDTVAHQLRDASPRITIPRSVGGLVTRRMLVMHFLEGVPLTEAGKHVAGLSEGKKAAAQRRILSRVCEAYGRMILGSGLFQADGHPGNILIGRGGRVGLLDYGQSKQLPDAEREALAALILELDRGDAARISAALGRLGIVTDKADARVRTEMAYGMFDTRGKVDPFDPNSPIKQSAITQFPPDLFFVLRVVQLLRGLANGMGITDLSCAHQWAPYARAALKQAQRQPRQGDGQDTRCGWGLRYLLWPLPGLART